MDTPQAATAPPSHPGPARQRIGAFSLWFGLLGAAAAWSLDELIAYGMASHMCSAKGAASAQTMVRATSPWYLGMTALTFAVALAGLWVAIGNWRRVRDEQPDSGHRLLQVGEGRTRFMAMCAVMTSAAFVLGFVFLTLQMLTVPLCEQ